jgi:endonuclease/exonuclease/phosphatase family metal-dependent hydrolase
MLSPILWRDCALLLALAALSLSPLHGFQEDHLRLMTFNIRYGAADDGENSWPQRRSLVAETIRRESPDVLAIQEALAFQLEDLSDALEGYRKLGQHRDGGLQGEFSGLYVRTDRVRVLDWGEFWLSPAPDSVGSVGWDAALPRMAAWADVEWMGRSGVLRVYGTHFDHRGAQARVESARLLLAHADGGPPAVFMGDFNAHEETEPILTFLRKGYRSAVLVLHPEIGLGTFNGFRDSTGGQRIDHILVDPRLEIGAAAILATEGEEVWSSDHFPVTATLPGGLSQALYLAKAGLEGRESGDRIQPRVGYQLVHVGLGPSVRCAHYSWSQGIGDGGPHRDLPEGRGEAYRVTILDSSVGCVQRMDLQERLGLPVPEDLQLPPL